MVVVVLAGCLVTISVVSSAQIDEAADILAGCSCDVHLFLESHRRGG
jgi:hypothetical protein